MGCFVETYGNTGFSFLHFNISKYVPIAAMIHFEWKKSEINASYIKQNGKAFERFFSKNKKINKKNLTLNYSHKELQIPKSIRL